MAGVDFSDPFEAFRDEIAVECMAALRQAMLEAQRGELPAVPKDMADDLRPHLRDLYFRTYALAFQAVRNLDPVCAPRSRIEDRPQDGL